MREVHLQDTGYTHALQHATAKHSVTRLAREVLRAVRERVGDDHTVGIRIAANEHNPAGLDAKACREVVAALRARTRIDFLDTAAGGYHDVHWVFPSSAMPAAWLRDDARARDRGLSTQPVARAPRLRQAGSAADRPRSRRRP